MILNEQDRGRAVHLGRGDPVTVRLAENPTTGYRWQIDSADGLEVVNDQFEPGGAVGAAGVRVLQFRCPNVGEYELRLKNRREWEGDASIVGRFDAKILVT